MELRTLNMDLTVEKDGFNDLIKLKREELGSLQRKLLEKNIPVIIVFDGWVTSLKGKVINSVLQGLDARGYKLHSGYSESLDANDKPFFWQYWRNIPAYGQIALFERSWYHKAIGKAHVNSTNCYEPSLYYSDINNFEEQLIDDGQVIVKFFLHVSKNKHEKRVPDLDLHFGDLDIFDEIDLTECKHYKKFTPVYEDMLRQTNTAIAPWYTIEADNSRYAQLKVFDTLIKVLNNALNGNRPVSAINIAKQIPNHELTLGDNILDSLDLNQSMDKDIYKNELKELQKELQQLQLTLLKYKIPMLILLEGSDAAGKGGAIKRIIEPLDPRGYYVIPISAPKGEERTHHYLWRFWKVMPAKGQIAIFDRTWYGRVLVERIEGFAKPQEWERAYGEINELESQLVHDNMILVKLWLQIDKEEQLKRFLDRQNDPERNWKITDEDWRNREKWDEYELAKRDMFAATNTTLAPWTIVEATCKYYARIKAIKTVINSIKRHLNYL